MHQEALDEQHYRGKELKVCLFQPFGYDAQKVKDIKYPQLFCVADICYTCTHSIYEVHKKS